MDNHKAPVNLLTIIIIISLVVGYVAGFFIYKDYREKISYLDKQAQFALDKFTEIENGLKDVYVTLDNTMDKNKIGRKDILSKLNGIKKDIEEWKDGYKATVLGMRKSIDDIKVDRINANIENLNDEITSFKIQMQDMDLRVDEVREKAASDNKGSIDLGKISVKK